MRAESPSGEKAKHLVGCTAGVYMIKFAQLDGAVSRGELQDVAPEEPALSRLSMKAFKRILLTRQ